MKAKKKLISILLTLSLLTAFIPSVNADAASGKTTVYVISKITTKKTYDKKRNGEKTFTYSKNGLVTNCKSGSDKKGIKFFYKGKKLVKAKNSTMTYKFKYDNKGHASLDMKSLKGELCGVEFDEKNRVLYNLDFPGMHFFYNNKGQITKKYMAVVTGEKSPKEAIDEASIIETLSYDSKGYATKKVCKYPNDSIITKFKNTYKSGRLKKVKVIYYNKDGKINKFNCVEETITYKKITVPKSYKKRIEKQQRNIIECGHVNGGWNQIVYEML